MESSGNGSVANSGDIHGWRRQENLLSPSYCLVGILTTSEKLFPLFRLLHAIIRPVHHHGNQPLHQAGTRRATDPAIQFGQRAVARDGDWQTGQSTFVDDVVIERLAKLACFRFVDVIDQQQRRLRGPFEQRLIIAMLVDALLDGLEQGHRRDIQAGFASLTLSVGNSSQQMRFARAIGAGECQRSLRRLGESKRLVKSFGLPLALKAGKGLLLQVDISPCRAKPGKGLDRLRCLELRPQRCDLTLFALALFTGARSPQVEPWFDFARPDRAAGWTDPGFFLGAGAGVALEKGPEAVIF